MTHKDFILLTCYMLAFNCVTGLKRDKSNGLRRPFFNHPQCPRQQEMIAEGRTCLKKCLTDADCRGSRRQCLCDGACGNGCVRIAMKCKHLDELKHGSFEIHPRNAFGSVVRYSCDEGYILSGKKERTCQGDGRWSGDAPTCETEGNCRDPPTVENSIYNRTTDPAQSRSSTPLTAGPDVVYPLGTQLVYRCLDGFEAIGFHKSMCVGEGRWVGPKMSCSPKRCGHPGEIPNGRREGGAFVYESRVNYTCRSGYELVGRPYRVCQANGVWSGSLPVCRPTKCPRPAPLDNGVIAGTDFSFGSVIRYSCSRGYLLTGEAKRSCQHDKTWSGRDPVCTIVRCPDLDQIANGYSRNTIETTYNSTVYFYCVGKSQSYGESMFTTCKEDGRWSNPVPKCLNKCEIPSVEHGNISKPFSEGDFVDHRERFPLECDDGFVVEMDTRCNNGSWNGSTKCVPSRKPCSSSRPPELKDGSFRFHSTDHGEYAQYTCEAGYQLEGDDKRVCRNGEWEALNQEPSCTAKNCTYPGKLLHGDILLVGVRGKFIYREYVRKIGHNEKVEYRCSKEYSLEGPDGATCVDGKWSPERKPNCTLNSYMLIEKFKSLRERRAV